MKSIKPGKNILKPEITNISEHGFWLFWNKREYFLDFKSFPWFKNAKISEITNVEVQGFKTLHWPDLDVDLSTEIISHPEKYELISK